MPFTMCRVPDRPNFLLAAPFPILGECLSGPSIADLMIRATWTKFESEFGDDGILGGLDLRSQIIHKSETGETKLTILDEDVAQHL